MMRCVLSLGALALLSACGIKGDLDRPDPLWKSDEAIRHECARQAAENKPQDARCAQYQTGADQPQQ
jgi:predicted small lipoprotein YifL